MRTCFLRFFKSLLALFCFSQTPLFSAALTWNVAGSGAWDTTTANWSAGTFTDGGVDDVTFNNAAGGTITISANMTPNSTAVSAAAGTYTFTGGPIDGGTLTKSGSGTLILSGANSYAGATSISAGVLNIQNNSALGSTAGTTSVASGAALQIQGNITVTGENITIVGGGGASNGAIRNISGSNTWTGNVTVSSAATTRIGSDAGTLLISGNVALSPTSTDLFVLQGVSNGEISGVISGVSQIFKSGFNAGTWTLSGANTYTGKTSIANGALSVASLNRITGGSASSSLGAPTTATSGTIDLGSTTTTGTLIYTGSGETTDRVLNLAGTTGGATLDQSGTGSLQFSSALTATGSGAKTLTLQGSTSGTGEIAGAIVNSAGGATSLTKSGTGTWTLSGTNTATGLATINGGTLIVGTASGGNWAGAITANSGATLKGRGAISGAVTINSGATYSPGNSPGIQSVGSLTLNSGSNTIIEIDGATAGNGAGFHDQIQVTGAATINSGTTLTPQTIFSGSSGYKPSAGQKFTILTAGSLTGQFTTIDNSGNPTNLTFVPVYSSTQIDLYAVYASLSLSLQGLTTNQRNIATILDGFQPTQLTSNASPSNSTKIYQGLLGLQDHELKSAIDQLSPEKLSTMSLNVNTLGSIANSGAHQRLQQSRGGDRGLSVNGVSLTTLDGDYEYERIALDKGSMIVPKIKPRLRNSFFVTTTGSYQEIDSAADRVGSETRLGGITVGIDREFHKNLTLGVFLGEGYSDTVLDNGGNVKAHSGRVGLYGGFHQNGFYFNNSLSGGITAFESERNISFLNESASGSTLGYDLSGQTTMGVDFQTGQWVWGPLGQFNYCYQSIDSFKEKDSSAALKVFEQTAFQLETGAGLRISRPFSYQGWKWIPEIRALAAYEWYPPKAIEARFNAGGRAFTVTPSGTGHTRIKPGAGFSLIFSDYNSLHLFYESKIQESALTHQLDLSWKHLF